MLTRLDLRGRSSHALRTTELPRPRALSEPPVDAVREIVAAVRRNGDAAVRELTERFDRLEGPLGDLRVPPEACRAALGALDPALHDALALAKGRITAYHEAQLRKPVELDSDGIRVSERIVPVERAGAYVPGGEAPLVSTVLMTALPARVAGVREVVLCTPPGRGGEVAPELLAAAALAGVDEVYRIGGAQAIAAMAYGTESIAAVDVIVGPGNMYVALAKQEVAGVVGVPSAFAGPSEVVIVADQTTPAALAAIDLMVQVEHGPDSMAWLITWSAQVADQVVAAVAELVAQAARGDVIRANLEANGWIGLVDGPVQAIELVNEIAPEHLELMNADPQALVPLVRHAGAVFCGPWSPASLGDYLAGPNHVLPTSRSARFAGALSVDDFCKHIHVVTAEPAGLAKLAPHLVALAEAEGLATHAESVRLRGQA